MEEVEESYHADADEAGAVEESYHADADANEAGAGFIYTCTYMYTDMYTYTYTYMLRSHVGDVVKLDLYLARAALFCRLFKCLFVASGGHHKMAAYTATFLT